MYDPGLMGRLHGSSQRRHQGGRLTCRLGSSLNLLSQAAPLDKLHREIQPAFVLTHVIDLHDVRMMQSGNRHRFALKSQSLVRAGIGTGQKHFERDHASEAQLPGLVDNSDAATAEDRLDFVPEDARELLVGR